nr:NADPH-dependent F420 reductase [Georgenia sp. SYP-B2076]
MTIGIIGSGNVGRAVARLAVRAGFDVVLSNSRGPESLADAVSELGEHARAGSAADAARNGRVVLVAVPLKACADLPVEAFTDKVVIDATNYYPARDGQIPELDDASTTTSELLQAHLANSKVVKGLNSIAADTLPRLARPAGSDDRTALPVAGDDQAAKAAVIDLLDRLGYDAVDAGPLSEGWRFQRDTPAYVAPYMGPGGVADARPTSAERIRTELRQADRDHQAIS